MQPPTDTTIPFSDPSVQEFYDSEIGKAVLQMRTEKYQTCAATWSRKYSPAQYLDAFRDFTTKEKARFQLCFPASTVGAVDSSLEHAFVRVPLFHQQLQRYPDRDTGNTLLDMFHSSKYADLHALFHLACRAEAEEVSSCRDAP
mgnify:FL=1